MSDSALGQTSEAELSDSQGNENPSEMEKQQSQLKSERKACIMSASTSSMSCDTNSDRHESNFESIKESQDDDSNDKAAGIETKSDRKESELQNSVSCVIHFQNNNYLTYFCWRIIIHEVWPSVDL